MKQAEAGKTQLLLVIYSGEETDVRITMENCGNIEIGDLQLMPGVANIKYAYPGSGKTVLATALEAFIRDDAGRKEKLRLRDGQENTAREITEEETTEAEEWSEPELFGYESLKSVACFDERFVNRFAWRRSKRQGVEFELSVKPEVQPPEGSGPRRVYKSIPCNIPVLIKEAMEEINYAMKYLDYPFRIAIEEGDGEDSPLNNVVLKMAEPDEDVDQEDLEEMSKELTEPRKIAIAFMVFRKYAVKMDPSLIVIDELDVKYPKNELYVMLLAMFFWENGFKNKTTLYLTRNRYIVADCLYYLYPEFEREPYVTFMANAHGELTEQRIRHEHICSTGAWAVSHINDKVDIFYRLIFLKRSMGYYSPNAVGHAMLESLFEGRKEPEYYVMGAGVERPMQKDEYEYAQQEIREYIPDFDYKAELKKRRRTETMYELYDGARCSYEKLVIYLMLIPKNKWDKTVLAYIMNVFLPEEEWAIQIDPVRLNQVPTDIIERCDKEMKQLREKKK